MKRPVSLDPVDVLAWRQHRHVGAYDCLTRNAAIVVIVFAATVFAAPCLPAVFP